MSMLRVFRLNAPEWLYMVVGCFCSLINGATQPAFAIIFAEVIESAGSARGFMEGLDGFAEPDHWIPPSETIGKTDG